MSFSSAFIAARILSFSLSISSFGKDGFNSTSSNISNKLSIFSDKTLAEIPNEFLPLKCEIIPPLFSIKGFMSLSLREFVPLSNTALVKFEIPLSISLSTLVPPRKAHTIEILGILWSSFKISLIPF